MLKFQDYLNENIQVEGMDELVEEFTQGIASTLHMINQFHIFHWNTKSYAKHEAIGDFYEGLQDKVDNLVEHYLAIGGYYSDVYIEQMPLNFTMDPDNDMMVNILEGYRNRINSCIDSTNQSNMMSVNDDLISIVKLIDKTAYKLQQLD